MIEYQPSSSSLSLPVELGHSKNTINQQLHNFSLVNRRCRDVAYELTNDHVHRFVKVSKQLASLQDDILFGIEVYRRIKKMDLFSS